VSFSTLNDARSIYTAVNWQQQFRDEPPAVPPTSLVTGYLIRMRAHQSC